MKIGICYSGQLKNIRMFLDSHINNLFIPLIDNKYTIDVYMYTDNYNSARNYKDFWYWEKTPINQESFTYFKNRIKNYVNNINIVVDNDFKYERNDHNLNLLSQFNKFYNVLKMVNDDYDFIIRLRPDINFESKINLNELKDDTVYQNREILNFYNGDSIQIFRGIYLSAIIENTYIFFNNKRLLDTYENTLNNIFSNSGLKIEYISDFVSRWYNRYAIYYPYLKLQYFDDWVNIEYPFTFSIDKLREYISIRKNNNNILIYNSQFDIKKDDINRSLYLSALNPDIYINCNDDEIIYKDIVGLIPCSGTASRMSGIPKFLLPCKEGNLIDNSINIFKSNNVDDIYVSISNENEHFIKNRDNIKYIVKNTNTMSETVKNLIEIKSKKYILIMPDTYFINDSNKSFNEITKMYMMLNKFDIVVILWKIKEYQFGKLGQVDINEIKVIDVMDKNIDCKYPYSWGIIGWTNKVNHLIDEKTPHIGYILNEALKNNIDIGYILSDTDYYDCGTPDEYFKMIKKCTL
jgi:hypothetical protein